MQFSQDTREIEQRSIDDLFTVECVKFLALLLPVVKLNIVCILDFGPVVTLSSFDLLNSPVGFFHILIVDDELNYLRHSLKLLLNVFALVLRVLKLLYKFVAINTFIIVEPLQDLVDGFVHIFGSFDMGVIDILIIFLVNLYQLKLVWDLVPKVLQDVIVRIKFIGLFHLPILNKI